MTFWLSIIWHIEKYTFFIAWRKLLFRLHENVDTNDIYLINHYISNAHICYWCGERYVKRMHAVVMPFDVSIKKYVRVWKCHHVVLKWNMPTYLGYYTSIHQPHHTRIRIRALEKFFSIYLGLQKSLHYESRFWRLTRILSLLFNEN